MKTENIETPKVALAMIVKDDSEASDLRRCLTQARNLFDGLYITGTNKPDDEIQKITKEFNGEYSYFQWNQRFADARNYNLSQVPKDKYEFYFWLDADDYLSYQNTDCVHELAVNAKLHNVAAVFLPYWYQVDLDDKGNVREVVIEHLRERLVRNDGNFKWIGGLHETLIEQQQSGGVKTDLQDPVVIHLSNPDKMEKNLSRNISILESILKEEQGRDPRTVIYLAKAYFDRGKFKDDKERAVEFDQARLLFNQYLHGSGDIGSNYKEGSGWAEERAHAWGYISEMARIEGKFNDAIIAGLNAVQEAPQFPNFYLDMAMTYAARAEWDKSEQWLKLFANVPIPRTTMIINRRDLKARALEIDMQIALAKNELPRAMKASEMLVSILPKVEPILLRHEQLLLTDESNKAAQSVLYLAKYLERNGQENKIPALLNAIPQSIENETFVAEIRNRFLPPRKWSKNEIAIFCGPGIEQWSPNGLNTSGMGGSEEAVVRLSNELTQQGYKVTVYAQPNEEKGEYDGVQYNQYYEINTADEFNIVILWRAVGFADIPINAKQKYLWLHDVPNNPDFTKERVDKLDKIFVLSQYHKDILKLNDNGSFVDMPEGKVVVSANGITEIKVASRARDFQKIIWTSSYDRGLPYLLKMWPEIRKEVPNATLDIFYGWNIFDIATKNNPGRQAWKARVIKMMQQEGITHHGRVGQDKIVEATLSSGVWAYPTDFQEISCISAMKAQAYGAIPVVTNYAALQETVQYGKKVEVDITTQEGQEEYKKNLIEALVDSKWQKGTRPEMMTWAREKFTWKNIATQWKNIFEEDSKKVRVNLL